MAGHIPEFKDRHELEEWVVEHFTRAEIDAFADKLMTHRAEIEQREQDAAKPPRLSEVLKGQGEKLSKIEHAIELLAKLQEQQAGKAAQGQAAGSTKKKKSGPGTKAAGS